MVEAAFDAGQRDGFGQHKRLFGRGRRGPGRCGGFWLWRALLPKGERGQDGNERKSDANALSRFHRNPPGSAHNTCIKPHFARGFRSVLRNRRSAAVANSEIPMAARPLLMLPVRVTM